MASFGEVEINVHHIQHTTGAIEAFEVEHQAVDSDRLARLLGDLRQVALARGFDVHSTELIQSFQTKRGHMPELHLVLVQLPLDIAESLGMLDAQLREVVRKRGDRGER